MSPDHDCVDGVCSDGDFMLTDIPEFSMVLSIIILLYFLTFNHFKIHIHSVDHHGGIIAEEFDKGTTINTYIGVSTETPSTPVIITAQSDEPGDETLPVIRLTTQSPRVELKTTIRPGTTPPQL